MDLTVIEGNSQRTFSCQQEQVIGYRRNILQVSAHSDPKGPSVSSKHCHLSGTLVKEVDSVKWLYGATSEF